MSETNLRAATQRSGMLDLPDGSTLEFRPLTIRDWGTLEEEALKEYRRQYLQFHLSNADLLYPDNPEEARLEIISKAERLALDDLPEKNAEGPAFDANGRPIKADGLKIGDKIQTKDGEAVVANIVANHAFVRQNLPYINWWLGRTIRGQTMAIWLSTRKARPTMTYDQLCDLFAKVGESIREQAGDLVADLSKSSVGNE